MNIILYLQCLTQDTMKKKTLCACPLYMDGELGMILTIFLIDLLSVSSFLLWDCGFWTVGIQMTL